MVTGIGDIEQVVLRVPNTDFTFKVTGHKKDESVLRTLRESEGYYEEWVYSIINSLLPHDAVVMDIGAHIGVISLLMAKIAKSGKIIAFEASPENYALLVKNITDNFIKNIQPENLAIYNKETTLTINHVEEFSGGAFLSGPRSSYRDDRARTYHVKAVRLDDWARENNINRLDFIKMDVEGTEKASIEGSLEVLKKFRPYLIIEFNLYTIKNIQNEDPLDLFFLLKETFPYIFMVNRTHLWLTELSGFNDLLRLTQFENGVLDLFCTFSRDLYRTNTFFIKTASEIIENNIILEKDRIIAEKESTLREKDGIIEEKEKNLKEKDKIIEEENNAIQALLESKSFKIGRFITYPYRKIRDILLK